ncbi:MAG: ATP-binding protein [Chloroflexota bacterium]|nr:ATP-binding protein [Chloroflexota bacterium]
MTTQIHTKRPVSLLRQFNTSLLFVITLLVTVSLLRALTTAYTLSSETNLRTQTQVLQKDEDTLLSAMTDQETGLRGYITTANPLFLQPFNSGRPRFLAILRDLRQHLSGPNFRTSRSALDQVATGANEWYSSFALVQLTHVQHGNLASARAEQTSLAGKILFDRFRATIVRLDQALSADNARIAQQDAMLIWISVALVFGLSLLVIFILWVLFRHIARRLFAQLATLRLASQQTATGDLSTRVPLLGYEELHALGLSFNTMATTLLQKQADNEQLVQKLEGGNEQLTHANSTLRALLDSAYGAIFFVLPNGYVQQVNRRFVELFTLEAADIVGQPITNLVSHWKQLFVDPDIFEDYLENSRNDQTEAFSATVVQETPQHREYDLYSTPVLSADGAYLGRFYSLRDVTQEREVDRMKSEFVSLVSHELRTPLTSIQGYIDLLLHDEEVGPLTALQQEFLGVAHNNARRLVGIINDLLDLSRIESGKIELHREPLHLTRIIQELLPTFSLRLEEKQQELVLHLPDPSPIVQADSERIVQVLSNLLSNAHKYTPQGGRIDLTVETTGTMARISVTDTGIGLSVDEQAQLFTRFYRAQNTMSQTVNGTGLGLTIARTLVELHGGEITLTSTPGQGSTFSFTLPLVQHLLPMAQGGRLGKRILVVDDESDIAHLLQHTLAGAGYEVIATGTGAGALELAKTIQPDLITLDLGLPDMYGLTVLAALKAEPSTANIPVIILTVSDGDRQDCMLDAIDYLHKPIKADVLLERIANVFASVGTGAQASGVPT